MSDDAKILAGRYEVGDLIGRGGMAEVHIGYDTRLGRTVAIKVLRADLARDPSFQTRFRREAQAAAGLNHPTIVAVYDTGEDTIVGSGGAPQAVPFIVMEYVEGHTVRDILKGDHAAPIDEAIEIVSGVLAALQYSHHAGLVHRDIKPGNVMLTPAGAVKVMDFGIARALADAGQTMTQTQAVVGTAQYLSPEQARGETVDARSDLYSTGCLLFELLTGRPPFIGDSPVSVAYQHVREAAPRPSQYASDVPAALDQIVLRALAKDRNERYSSAGEFLADLRAFTSGDPVDPATGGIGIAGAAALGAAGVLGAAALTDDERAAAAELPTQAMPAVPDAAATAVLPPQQAPWATVTSEPVPAVAAAAMAPPLDTTVLDDDEEEERRRKRRLWWILGGSAAAALLVILAIILFNQGGGPEDPGTQVVPTLEGNTRSEAEAKLTALGFVPVFEEEASDDIEVGLVTRTEPPAGEELAVGEEITVFLSTGPADLTIPDVAGMTQEEAIAELEAKNLRVQRVDPDDTKPDVEKGLATGTDPAAGSPAKSGDSVVLLIASGEVELPDVTGKSEDEARSILDDLGLQVETKRVETSDHPAGDVYKQSPGPGRVDVGSKVTITVATAKTTGKVPNVIGMTESDATDAILADGFKVTVKEQESSEPAGIVFAQSPDAGISLELNQPVTIFVSTGPAPSPTADADADADADS